jgi:hypothetical protein
MTSTTPGCDQAAIAARRRSCGEATVPVSTTFPSTSLTVMVSGSKNHEW